MNKHLGQIKFQINAKTEHELTDISIIRKTGVIKIKGKIVVESGGDGCVLYKDGSIETLIRNDVDAYMKRWLSKIGRE